ncbi:MAG: DsbE family thiol:disulfide interchange protein [Pseudomonadota bacterium]
MKRLFYALPVLLALGLGVLFVWGLNPNRDPNAVPSVLISQQVPEFDLPAVGGMDVPGLAASDLVGSGELTLLNVFASWCVPCRAEHGVLTSFVEKDGLRLVGLNYKDRAESAAAFLDELGNPYARIGHDFSGRTAIEWGVTGVPETFIISPTGVVLYRFAGPIVGATAVDEFNAALDQARARIRQ